MTDGEPEEGPVFEDAHADPRERESDADSADGYQSDSGRSQESVAVSLGDGPFNPSLYIDMGEAFCRAVYPAQIGRHKRRVSLVCGRGAGLCRFHASIPDYERAPERVYVRQRRAGIEHGRMDLVSYSPEEFASARARHETTLAADVQEATDRSPNSFQSPLPRNRARESSPFQANSEGIGTTSPARSGENETAPTDPAQASPERLPELQRAEAQEREQNYRTSGEHNMAENVNSTSPSSRGRPREATRRSVTVDTGANTYQGVSEGPHRPRERRLYYGLESRTGERVLLEDPDEVLLRQEQAGWTIQGLWDNAEAAQGWLDYARASLQDTGHGRRGNGASIRASREPRTSQAARRPQGPTQRTGRSQEEAIPIEIHGDRARSKRNSSAQNSQGSSRAPSASSLQTTQHRRHLLTPTTRGSAKRGSQTNEDPSWSDPSDSSSSVSSSESSSESSDDSSVSTASSDESTKRRSRRTRRQRKRSSRKKKRKMKKSKKRTNHTRSQLYGRASADPSTGTDDQVYGKHLTDPKLEKKLCPPGMTRQDREDLSDLLMDVTHLPGRYNTDFDTSEELTDVLGEELRGLGDAIISATRNCKNKSTSNVHWESERRTVLLKVNTEEHLVEMIERVHGAEKPAFKKQSVAIQRFMRCCRYSGTEVDEYLRGGLWLRIIEDTFKWYLELLEHIRRIATKHGTWTGLAKEMVSHHSRKLADIRLYAVEYRVYLLEVYIYLREHRKEKFQNASIQEALWRTNKKAITTNDDHQIGRNSGCAHCKSKAFHEAMDVNLGRSNCPLKEVPQAKAKQIASECLSHFRKNPDIDKGAYVKDKVAASK